MTIRVTQIIWISLIGTAVAMTDSTVGAEDEFLSWTRQLTFDGRRSGEGYFSPDGSALIFQSEREPDNPFFQIYILDLKTGDVHRVSSGTGKTTCAFFRPGTDRVLFASTHLDPDAKAKQKAEMEFRASGKERRYSWDYDPEMDIFEARRDGSELKRLTDTPGYDAEAAYSPDGEWIVFTSLRHAYPPDGLDAEDHGRLEVDPSYFGEIYLMRADGTDVRRLTHTPGYDGGPFFSPDGERILWRRFDAAGNADIYTMDRAGGALRRLTDFHSLSWAPFFHPSGAYVIFTSNKLGFGNFELFIVDARGDQEPVQITSTDGFDGLPVFGPSGNRLCWASNRGTLDHSQLFMAQWDHQAALRALASAPAREGRVSSEGAPVAEERAALQVDGQGLTPDVTSDDLRRHVEFLASDTLQGRLTGSEGASRAADYISAQLQQAQVTPAGGSSDGSFFQDFEFTSGIEVASEGNSLTVNYSGSETSSAQSFVVGKDFRPLSFTANGTAEGSVVFAGYGLVVPGKLGEGYNSYDGLNVTNRIVVALRYVPEGVTPERRQELNRYAGLRYKAMMARERGAKALLVVTGPNSPNAGELIPMTFDSSLSGSGIVAASVTTDVAEALLRGTGKTLKEYQQSLDTEDPHAVSALEAADVSVRLSTAVERIHKVDRNVLGAIEPRTQTGPATYVLVGAHYDHLGFGESGSRQSREEADQIHNGADDNASGVAAVLELAAALSAERQTDPTRFEHGILFGFWSGEELGLIGSSHFAEHPPVALSNLVAYVNLDMVGRLRENKLIVQGVGSSPAWTRWIEKRNVAAGFDLVLQEDPYLPTDVTSFYPKGVPVLSLFTGSHDEYHRPGDDVDTLNYEGLERIAHFSRGLVLDLTSHSEHPEYVQVERTGGGGNRDSLRVYLGTIPDYSTDVAGVKLSGVSAGGPADQAGLRGGDVIVEFAGREITNIYDYTYALDAAKIGEPVEVVIERNGERRSIEVIPAARK